MLLIMTIISTGVTLLATLHILKWKKPAFRKNVYTPRVSILKPVRGLELYLRENLESFFLLKDSVEFELLISVKRLDDPAIEVIEALIEKYPNVKAHLFAGTPDLGRNPKVSNMHYSWNRAKNDLILISDSNVRVSPDYLEVLLAQRQRGAGLVTQAVYGAEGDSIGGHLDVIHLNTFYLKGTAFLQLLGHENVLGKCMLLSRSHLDSLGGLDRLKDFLAEDLVAGEVMKDAGYSIKVVPQLLRQSSVMSDFSSYWNRHIRWSRLRKCHFPLAYLIEPALFETLWPVLLLIFGTEPTSSFIAALSLSVQFLCNLSLHTFAFKDKSAWLSFPYFIMKDLIAPVIWLSGLLSNKVIWRGQPLYLRFGGQLKAEPTRVWD